MTSTTPAASAAALPPPLSAAPIRTLLASASLTLAWMVHPHTRTFTYTAADAAAAHAGSGTPSPAVPLRLLATALAAGALLSACAAHSRAALALPYGVTATLRLFSEAAVVQRQGGANELAWAHLSAFAMREPVSTVAHSGILIAALVRAPPGVAGDAVNLIQPLAEGIARQQRRDGSLQARLKAGS